MTTRVVNGNKMSPKKKHLVDQVDGLNLSDGTKKTIRNFLCLHEFELSKDQLPTDEEPWVIRVSTRGEKSIFIADGGIRGIYLQFLVAEKLYISDKKPTVITFVGDEHLPTGKKFEAIWL
jgi:hypothetical protein